MSSHQYTELILKLVLPSSETQTHTSVRARTQVNCNNFLKIKS